MKKKIKAFIEGKGKWVIISTTIFALIGLIALVVGFGLTYGWMAVLSWFVSRWAIYIYIIIALIGFVVVWVIFRQKIGGE